MAIALVKAGTIVDATTTSVAPAFGQATTSGNLLVAGVITNGNPATTSSSGWLSATATTGNVAANCLAIWYKPNCGASEAAPTFTSSATIMSSLLAEFSGAVTSSPVNGTGGVIGNAGVVTLTYGPSPVSGTDLVVWVNTTTCTKSCTVTFSGDSAGVLLLGDDGATKQIQHTRYLYSVGTTTNSETATVSTGSGSSSGIAASFFSVSAFLAAKPNVTGQSIRRSSLY